MLQRVVFALVLSLWTPVVLAGALVLSRLLAEHNDRVVLRPIPLSAVVARR